jgi:hypothetical protein
MNIYYTGSLTPNSGNGGESDTSKVKAGTVFTIPTDFETLQDVIAFLDGQWSDGAITIKYEKGTYEINEQQIIREFNIRIPILIVDGQESTFNVQNQGFLFTSSNYEASENIFTNPFRTKFIFKNFTFTNVGNTGVNLLKFQGFDWGDILITSCTFNNAASGGAIVFENSSGENYVTYCEFNNSLKFTQDYPCFINSIASNVYSSHNIFVNTNTSVAEHNGMQASRTGIVKSAWDTFNLGKTASHAIVATNGALGLISGATLTQGTKYAATQQNMNNGVIYQS